MPGVEQTVRVVTAADERAGAAVVERVIGRLIPFIFCCYVVAYLDRVNVGFAARDLQRDLGLSDAAYGFGAGLFFLGYFLFEIPSNLLLQRFGARRWIARIMVVWGLVSMGTMFVQGETSFYVSRVLLGLAEAGFFPGIILYLTYWIPAADRARAGALFMTAIPVAVIIGSPVSEALLALDGWLGLHGWQWLFLIEGVPAVILGVACLWRLTDRPEQADWLKPAEREWLTRQLEQERLARQAHQTAHGLKTLLTGKVWLLSTIYFLNNLVTYGIFLWLPKILSEVSGLEGLRLSGITMIPFIVALVGMVVIGRHSDRTRERKLHVAACALTGAIGLTLAAFSQDSTLLIVCAFTLSQLGQRSILSVFWAIPPLFLGGTAAAAAIAFINSLGNLGGAAGPTIMGRLRSISEDYTTGLLTLAAVLVVEAILVLTIRLPKQPATTPATTPAAAPAEATGATAAALPAAGR